MLDLNHVSMTFNPGTVNEKKALTDINLHMESGEFATIVGSNGAGKSTLFNAIAGSFIPDTGSILLDGVDMTFQPDFRRSKAIGRLFQDPLKGTAPNMTIEENLALAYLRASTHTSPFSRITKADRELFTDRLVQLGLGLENRMKQPVGLLSGGQRQRVAIARALTMEPELLVADEPIASLDASIQAQIVNLFRHLQKEHGFSFLFIAHDLDMVEFLCDRVGVMYHGKLVETGPARAVFENPLHPYTKALIAAIPIPDPRRERARAVPDFSNTEFPRTGTLREVEKDHFVLMEGGDAG